MDYVAFFANELAYVGAVERLIGIEVPPARAVDPHPVRGAEPDPQPPDLPRHLGRRAGRHLAVLLLPARARHGARPVRDGDRRAHARPLPPVRRRLRGPAQGLLRRGPQVLHEMPKRIDEYLDLVEGNAIWRDRYRGIGTIDADTAIAMGLSGPNLRGQRRAATTCAGSTRTWSTTSCEFDVITGENGDAFDRLMCRTKEMYESVKLIEQCLDSIPDGPVMADDRALRAAAAQRAAHVDGVADPPLQAGHGGLPAAGRRALLRGRVAARRVRLLPGVGRQPASHGGSTSARPASSACRSPR